MDLGGFALVYAPGGAAERLFVVEKGEGIEAPSPVTGTTPRRPAPEAALPGRPGRVTVPFLIRKPEAEPMKLGTPGQVLLVESPPAIKTQTSECDGTPGDYPVQTVLVMDAATTYVTSIVVCTPEGLTPGQTLTPTPTAADPATDDLTYSRFGAAPR